jgi:hypothetical protein
MRLKRNRLYRPGDQIHFIVTDDFEMVANEFATYCKSNSINTSGAIRMAISEWLERKTVREKRLAQLEGGSMPLRTMADNYERQVLKEV